MENVDSLDLYKQALPAVIGNIDLYNQVPTTVMENVDPLDLYKQSPPTFGHELRKYFPLDPNYLALNHGSYGTAPYVVHKFANDLARRIEANPDKFLRIDYLKYLTDVRRRLAEMVHAQRDEIVLVPNNTVGINTILRNFEWEKDDIIICFNTSYNSIHRTIDHIGNTAPHPTVTEIQLNFPTTRRQIVDQFQDYVKSLPRPQSDGNRMSFKRVAVIDSITAFPGALLPWQDLVKICKEEGIWSVIDAAHSIGQEQNINLTKAAPDFWVSTCHKWLHAKRAVAMLYIPERNRHIIKTALPTSHSYKPIAERSLEDFLAQWDWNGTIEWIPFLAISASLDFRKWIGGEAKIFDYCHNLALEGGRKMAEIFGTRVMDPNGEFTLNMVNVELPFPRNIPWSPKIDNLFKTKMLNERNAYSVHYHHNGCWWTRCSAQIYNELQDFEKLANIWIEVCHEVKQEVLGSHRLESKL